MGAGIHGKFGNTAGMKKSILANNDLNAIVKKERKKNDLKVSLPTNKAQIEHIFGNRPGHLPDTPQNREILLKLANDKSKFVGNDKYGNSWNVELQSDGSQNWVRYRNGVINEGGKNIKPRPWNSETGLNDNPILRNRRKKDDK